METVMLDDHLPDVFTAGDTPTSPIGAQ